MKIFITGATGYIGGSLAQRLTAEKHQVSGLVRDEARAYQIEKLGIQPAIGTLDDADILAHAAQAADAVIDAASADHAESTTTFIHALRDSGKALIRTSGSSIVSDDARGEYASPNVFHEDSVFHPLPARAKRVELDRTVRRAGIDAGIRAIVLCPSMIYGEGRGPQKQSAQIPKLTEIAKDAGKGVYFGKGLNRWSNVHIDDVIDLYLLALEKAPSGSFFFAENGEESYVDIAEAISLSLGFDGQTVSLPVKDAVDRYGEWARVSIASNSRVRAKNARALLGWKPTGPSLRETLVGT